MARHSALLISLLALGLCLASAVPVSGEAWMDLYSYSYGPNQYIEAELGFISFYPSTFMGGCTVCPGGTCDNWMGIGISARAYVVPHGCAVNGVNLESHKVTQAHVIVQASSTSGFWDEVIGVTKPQSSIGDGTYDIVIDECEDGWFNADKDTVVATFTVSGTTDVGDAVMPGITAFKDNARAQWIASLKSRAAIQALDNVMKVYDVFGPLISIALDPVVGIIEFIADQTVVSFGGLTGEVRKFVLEQIETSETANVNHWEALKNDPPDPNYTVDVALDPIQVVEAESPDALESSTTRMANIGAQQAAVLKAMLACMEKFQGAANVDNKLYAIKQARALARYARLAASLGVELADASQGMSDAFMALPEDLASASARLVEMQSRLHPDGTGFTDSELTALRGAGVTDDKLPAIAQKILSYSASADPVADLAAASLDLSSSAGGNAAALEALARAAEDEIAQWMPLVTPFPNASAGGPYQGTAGTPITLSAAATTDPDTPQASLVFNWDTDGDGQFDDAAGVTASYTYPRAYDGLVGVRVQDTSGHTDTAYARARIVKANSAPEVSATPTTGRLVSPPSEQLSFSISVSDPDGDPTTVTWKLDGTAVQTGGMSYTYTPAAADVGLHQVRACVSDNQPSSPDGVAEWLVLVTDVPVMHVSPEQVDFGRVSAGSVVTASVEITNTGTADLTLSTPTLRAGTPDDFRILSPTGPTSVSPGGSSQISIEFRPDGDTARNGAIEFDTNDAAAPHVSIPITNNVSVSAGGLKQHVDGQSVTVSGMVVTRIWAGSPWVCYAQSAGRSSGIRVEGRASAPVPGDSVVLTGLLALSGAERTLRASSLLVTSHDGAPAPLGIGLTALGGSDWRCVQSSSQGQKGVAGGFGLNNIGLLITAWGKVTHVGDGFFYMDNESGLSDTSGYDGVRVTAPGLTLPSEGETVQVRGISSCHHFGGEIRRLIRVCEQEDIVVIE